MKKLITTIGLILLFALGQIAYGQSNQEKALAKGREAVKLEDQGKYDEAIKLLEEAQKLDPQSTMYPYELAYSYYSKDNYKKAAKYLEGIVKRPEADDQVYQLLGNCYDNMGKSDKALETYDKGLKIFPKSGKLYLEKGNVFWKKKEYGKAMPFYEQGIEADPRFPSNYYRAARLYCASTEEVWGMIYGEIFMNLERNTKRTAEISKLLYDTYKSQIKFIGDTSFSVSFSQNATISIEELTDTSKIKLPFGIGVYEPTLMMSMIKEKTVDINSLDRIRQNFVEIYYNNGNDKKYPNILFEFQHQLLQEGYLEAYNHWILMKGDEDGFGKWHDENLEKWDNFVKWFTENPMEVSDSNRFYSGQY
jgi:tetratricopeptide (TPR) repeat protein